MTRPIVMLTLCAFMVGLCSGTLLGGVYVAKSKAGQLADIVLERNAELSALQEKHSAEVAALYSNLRDKGADVLYDMDTDEIAEVTETEVKNAIENAGKWFKDKTETGQ